ncbi:MAG: DUF2313 domain-containing protein [Proteobacteria bacterium]|nr:MAG: DUF2313 domain-containing protein [Pseudomonadota bacterium]
MQKFSRLLLYFLPDGPPWPKDRAALSSEIAQIFADAISPSMERLDGIIRNLDPRTADIWLSEWERALGIPSARSDLFERQARAYAAFIKLKEISASTLKERIRSETGFSPSLDESYPLTVGEIEAGDELDGESSAFVMIVRGVPLSKRLFDTLKEFWQAHTLFVIEDKGRLTPVRGNYAPN